MLRVWSFRNVCLSSKCLVRNVTNGNRSTKNAFLAKLSDRNNRLIARDQSSSSSSSNGEWKMPEEHFQNQSERLVYTGNLEANVKRVKFLSLTTSLLGLACQPVIINKTLDGSTSKLAFVFVGWTCLAVIFSPFLLNMVTKRYVTKLTFDDRTKQFTATTLNFINRPKQIKFTRDDVHVPTVPGMFTSFLVHKQPLLIDPSLVIDKEAYSHLLGYDQSLEKYIEKRQK